MTIGPSETGDSAAPLREAWYYAAPSRQVRRAKLVARQMLGEPIVLGRGRDGAVFALRDICPHRGMPLSAGYFDGSEIECCYHGWRFAPDGRCMAIPSLVEGQPFDLSTVGVGRYPACELQGNIWVYFGGDPGRAPEVPQLDGFPEQVEPHLLERMRFGAAIDHCVVGLMDPAHGPFVHRAWWWRSRHSVHEKAKAFEPSPWGFTMSRHRPSSNSRAYRLVGGIPETEISFRLPSVRIEEIRTGRYKVTNLTALTPVDDATTEVNHCVYWDVPWLSVMKPLLQPYVRAFLRQDRDIMERQQQGLRHKPVLALIDDADTQARWYFRLKQEYRRARAEGRPFENPVKPRILHWRS
ncbi:MAG: aromatic ring-hydroxylating dioxygenase subunit alpha [Alphaproteobacteria bacterium]|nr:aromatic ring-hydroxylating dioxygenase subunit alpha [Alphaproteobacteria bacterium]